jgi:hypothetical protein
VLFIIGSLTYSISGCTKGKGTETLAPYPYLSSELNELIEADKQGKAEVLAQEPGGWRDEAN